MARDYQKIIFRLMHPKGRYPSQSLIHEDAAFVHSLHRGYIFTIVRQTESDKHQSEVCWATPSEIRLWASVALAYREAALSICIFPSIMTVLPFSAPRFDSSLMWQIAFHFDKTYLGPYAGELGSYHHRGDVCDPEIQAALLHCISPDDSVLIRGLANLLKSNILSSADRLFMEEAILLMFFAMEAGLEIARRQLEQEGIQNPSFEDAMEHVSSGVAPRDAAVEYFRECYDKRVVLVHPSNRVSAEVVPLLWADDFYDNYEVVADMYRRLLLGNKEKGEKK